MLRKIILLTQMILTLLFFVCLSFAQSGDKSFSELKGPYLGQKPPGISPEIFASGIISNAGYRLHGSPSFSLDGTEVYWTVIPPRILFSREVDGIWHAPVEINFAGFRSIQAPFLSNNGKRLYFQAASNKGFGSTDIWYVEKLNGGWSQPVNLDIPVNSDKLDSQPSFTRKGNLYFTQYMENSGFSRGIFYSEFINNKFTRPVALPGSINTENIDYTPFISQDEKILLFASSRPTQDEGDLALYLSFREGKNRWSEPISLSDKLGLKNSAKFPCISPDGKYFFFSSGRNIYWVDAKILEVTKKN